MTTAPARLYGPTGEPVNGHAVDRPKRAEARLPMRFAPFPLQAVTPAAEPETPAETAPAVDLVAAAEAQAIRLRAEAEAEERRIAAEAEAEVTRLKAAAEAEKLRLANERAAKRQEREDEEHALRVAKLRRAREEEERQAAAARAKAEAEEKASAAAAEKVEASANSWRKAAIGFAVVCGIVALPVQMHAFYNRHELWLLAAPIMLEGGAWVVNRGARAAVDERRPHWHYRLISWLLAGISATINFAHGIEHFDIATAIGTAFASIAGPGVWDLHEHGRIRKRDGKPSWREKRAAEKEAARVAAEERAAEKQRADEKAAAEKAAAEAAEKLSVERSERYPAEWTRAMELAAALGEATVAEAVWRRAWRDLHAADPGETVDVVRSRNVASLRMSRAVTEGAEKSTVKNGSLQVGSQMPASRRTGPKTGPVVRGIRRPGDTQKYSAAARKAASITAKQAAKTTPKEG